MQRDGLLGDQHFAELREHEPEIAGRLLASACNAAINGTDQQFRAFLQLCAMEGI